MKRFVEADADQEIVRDIARAVVDRLAPEELHVFPFISDAWFDDPQATLKGDEHGNDAVGVGLEEVVYLLTPIALAVASDVVVRLVGMYVEDGATRLGRATRDAVRCRFRRGAARRDGVEGAEPLLETTAEERDEVRRTVRDVVINNGGSEELAQQISDALTGTDGTPVDEDQVDDRNEPGDGAGPRGGTEE